MEGYSYFEHDADIGIIGRGRTVEAALVSAAEATFGIMTDLSDVTPECEMAFAFEEEDAELALVQWLNLLIAHAQSLGIVPCRFELHRKGTLWKAKAWGSPWKAGMERGVEVKGATLTMLSVEAKDGYWEARCIVDV